MKKTVLIVEDDQLLAEVYSKCLQAEGIKAVVANDAISALKAFRSKPINLVVLDIILGDSNGFDLLKKLRRQNGAHKIPILIVTGLNTDEISLNKELCVSLNIIGIYTKSQFAIAKLVEVVKDGLKKYESA
jgi:DNA-binding response OmpR family regulator